MTQQGNYSGSEELTPADMAELQTMIGSQDAGGFPASPERRDLFTWFNTILHGKNPDMGSKVGNLSDVELGTPKVSVRDLLRLASYSDEENLDNVSAYLREWSLQTNATSLSRKGFFMNLSVTQQRVSRSVVPQRKIIKKRLFGRDQETIEGYNPDE